MLRSMKELERYAVNATDGNIGHVVNFLIDDEQWAVRYLVVETNEFFSRPPVLVSPISFGRADWATQEFQLNLTREKVKHSPPIAADKPVSRQHERDFDHYYGYPYYWGYSGVWGINTYPGMLASERRDYTEGFDLSETTGDVHLRSVNELGGYHVQGRDGAVGHIHDFIVDDESWQVRYLVVDTRNWWFGKHVLIAPRWASRVSWDERRVFVDMSRQAIKGSPEWDPSAAVNRDYEARLYDYYGRPVYWAGDHPSPPTHDAAGVHG